MTQWKRIIGAIDFSDASWLVLAQAAHLARCAGAELTLVHVTEEPRPTMGARDLLAPSAEEVKAKVVDELMAEAKAEAERLSGRPVHTSVLSGAAAEELVRHAREQQADILVLATQGRTGLKRVVLGSVAEQVIRGASCPVLVVRAPDAQPRVRPTYAQALAKGLALPP